MSKKFIATVAIAAALFAGSVAAPAHAATATVSASQKKEVAAAVKTATDAGYAAVLVTGYKKPSAASKALVAYVNKYVAAKASDLTVVAAAGNAEDGLEVIAADNNTASHFEVNGRPVHDGDTVILPAGTTSVTTSNSPVSAFATVAVDGDTGLVAGDNILTFTVTAADGTQDIYSVDLQVAN
ncbi:MAG: hypothetical protein RJA35_1030 [Actinomycetota bacterium]|jgi:hypothetical protein